MEYAFKGEASQLSDESRYWYGRLKTLYEENNTELLFEVVPYQMPIGATEEATMENMKLYNATEDWCEENGVGYLNLFRELDGMHFDFSTDMQDVSHVNILGAEKVTRAVGEYISGNYDITDGRSDHSINED